ncbi:MAG: hypothetical protein KTR15_00145 [Phycisphaeraceae bacterium]|nr:hypothetical protein [Phycisphaeraceae bacterium]
MGWFLSNKTSKTKKKTKRGKSADPKWDPKRTLLGVKFAGFAGGILAVALAWHFGTQRLEAYVNTNHAQPIGAEDIRFSDEPTHLGVAELNQLRAELAQLIGAEPLNRARLVAAAKMLRDQHDLVHELRQVRRTPQGTVEIDVDFRTPAAIVQMRNARTGQPSLDGYHVIDELGYQMFGPKSLGDLDLAVQNLPHIYGVSSDFRPRDNHGEYRWQGPEVDAALALIDALKKTPAIDFIESISVNVRDERDRIRLVINTLVVPARGVKPVPCRIVWGLPPGQERAIEPDIDRKIAALTKLLGDGRYRMGHWQEVWINTGNIRPSQAIR